MERITTEHRHIHLSRDGDHRNRVHICRCKPRHEIRCARSRGGDADADTPCCACIAVRRVRRVLLMRHEHLTHAVLSIERIVERQNHTARIAEHRIHALLAQTCQNCFRTSHAHTLLKIDCIFEKYYNILVCNRQEEI